MWPHPQAIREVEETILALFCCLICCIIIGPILIVVGSGNIVSAASDTVDPSSNGYLQKVTAANKIIATWTGNARASFVGSGSSTGRSATITVGTQTSTQPLTLSVSHSVLVTSSSIYKQTDPRYTLHTWKAGYFAASIRAGYSSVTRYQYTSPSVTVRVANNGGSASWSGVACRTAVKMCAAPTPLSLLSTAAWQPQAQLFEISILRRCPMRGWSCAA